MKPRSRYSLRARLLLWLLIPLGLLGTLNIWFSHRVALRTANMVQDRLLLGSARIIAQQIQYEDGQLEVAIPPAALELFQSNEQDRVYYRIASSRGALLSGYAELPAPPTTLHPEESLYFSAQVRGQSVRAVAYAQPIFAAPGEGPVVIEVAQTLLGHQRMVQEILATSLLQELWELALVAILAWLALRRALKDIVGLRNKVRDRHPGSLEALEADPVPQEIQPLVEAINGYVQRLDNQMAVRNRFIANASHQLRTPFTVLQTQASFGLKSPQIQQKNEALGAIFQEVRHGTRLVNQLLSLSTMEARAQASLATLPVDVVEVAQHVLEEQAALAQSRGIDLGLSHHPAPILILATPSLVHELVANLVDNALRYTPPNGVVTVSVQRRTDTVILQVEDNGPGIPAGDRARVFERFCRLREADSAGSGLGLSIVQEIVLALGGQITLSDPTAGTGLVVNLTFPAAP